jgi:hypothetical protein
MAESLLDQIRSQIRERVRELQPVARDSERLEAALTALGGPVEAPSAPAPKPAAAMKRRAKRSTSGRPPAKRAPRGPNRAVVTTRMAISVVKESRALGALLLRVRSSTAAPARAALSL